MDYSKAVQEAYDGFARGDPDPLFGLFDPKIEWIEAAGFPYAGTYVGADEIGQGVFSHLQSDWDAWKVAPENIIAEGDRVVSIGTYSGTNKATGKPFEARFAHIWQFDDDKLIRFEQIVDSAMVNEAM